MAMLFDDEYIKCDCGKNKFTEDIEYVYKVKKGTVRNTIEKIKTEEVLRCTSCGKITNKKNFIEFKGADIIEQQK